MEEHRAIYEACMREDKETAAQVLERHRYSTLANSLALSALDAGLS